MNLVQIVPRLPPILDGLGDHAMQLAKQLRQVHKIDTRFIVGDPHWQGPAKIDSFPVDRVERRARYELLELLPPSGTVLLHYVGYGFARRGCPLWLVNGLQIWRRNNESHRLITMFHELYAAGPIWSSSFWNFPLQKLLVAKLANLSDICRTNRRMSASLLEKTAPKHVGRITVAPVFSNIGEPSLVRDYTDREPWLVLFGGDRWTYEAFTVHAGVIQTICGRLRLDRIIQVGSSINHGFKGRPVDVMGVLPSSDINGVLSQCKAGFLNYYPGYLAKSGIFAAYAAHGVVPIFPLPNNSQTDGLFCGEHYLLPANLAASDIETRASSVAKNVREWYLNHDLKHTASAFAEILKIEIL